MVFKKQSVKSNFRIRPATPPPASGDTDSSAYSSEDETGYKSQVEKEEHWRITASSKTNATPASDLTSTVYTADRNATIKSVNDATKQSTWYEDATDALSSKNLLGSTRAVPLEVSAPDETYKGLANQTIFIQKNPNAPTRTVGPVKVPTNIRTITVTDFAPDVCKDTSRRASAASAKVVNSHMLVRIISKAGN